MSWSNKESWERVVKVVSEPQNYFTRKEKDPEYRTLVVHYLKMIGIAFIPSMIMQALFDENSRFLVETNPPAFVGAMVGAIVAMSLLVLLVVIPLYHGYLYLFGAREPMQKTYHVVIAAATPGILLGWVPFVNLLASFYTIVLNWYGLRNVHKLSTTKTLFAVIIIPLVVTLVGLALL